jgi:hypothetical protein
LTNLNQDAGFYGKGIYFTSFVMYSTPYWANHRDPAILISFILTGNTFPVTEHHKLKGSLLG